MNTFAIEYPYNGGIVVSAMRGGYRCHKHYYGYELDEAIQLFTEEFPDEQD